MVVARSDNVAVRSMLAVVEVLELLTAARTLGAVPPDVLAHAIKKHLDAYGLSDRPVDPPHVQRTWSTHNDVNSIERRWR